MLTQAEADALIAMAKSLPNMASLDVGPGVDVNVQFESDDGTERFLLDVRAHRIRLTKFRYQARARRVYVLRRLCIDGPPHTNPDGEAVGRTHLHVYREGYEDKFAFALDPKEFTDVQDRAQTLREFCAHCAIGNLPILVESAGGI